MLPFRFSLAQPLLLVTTIQLEDSRRTAVGNTEEGGDDVKSSCLLRLGLQACYNGYNKEMVRFFAYLRIKQHAPLLVRVPVNSFEFQPCGRTCH